MTFLAFVAEHWTILLGVLLCLAALVGLGVLSWKAGAWADKKEDALYEDSEAHRRRVENMREIARAGLERSRRTSHGERA